MDRRDTRHANEEHSFRLFSISFQAFCTVPEVFDAKNVNGDNDDENSYRDLVHCLQPFRFVSCGIAAERKNVRPNHVRAERNVCE